MITVYRK